MGNNMNLKLSFAKAVGATFLALGSIGTIFAFATAAPLEILASGLLLTYGGFKTFIHPKFMAVTHKDIVNRLYPELN